MSGEDRCKTRLVQETLVGEGKTDVSDFNTGVERRKTLRKREFNKDVEQRETHIG